MNIANLVFSQLKVSQTNLTQSLISTNTKTNSFESQYQSYKNKYEPKQTNYNQTVQKNTAPKVQSKPIKKADTTDTSKVQKQSSNDKDNTSPKTKKEVEQKVINELSEKLGVPAEEIESILQELNIDVFGLMNTQNLNNFVQILFGTQNQADFDISNTDIQNMIKDITEVMQNNKEDIQNVIKLSSQVETQELANTLKPDEQVTDTKQQSVNQTVEDLNTTNIDKNVNKQQNNQVNLDTQAVNDTERQNELPVVEVQAETKGENSQQQNGSNLNYNNLQQQNTQPTVTNTYTYTNSQQQEIVVNEIVSNAKASTAANVKEVINQIVEKIKVDIKSDSTEMKLSLKPETLGELSLKITTQNGVVGAQLIAENQQVKDIIQSNLNVLKDSLQQMGLSVNEISVSVKQQESDTKQQFAQNQQKSKRRVQKILDGISNAEEIDINYSKDYVNPYEISDNQVDYSA